MLIWATVESEIYIVQCDGSMALSFGRHDFNLRVLTHFLTYLATFLHRNESINCDPTYDPAKNGIKIAASI